MRGSINDLLLVDTHVLLWSLLVPDKLTETTRQHIVWAQANNQLLISSISLWEIAMLNAKNRISIYEPLGDFLESIVNIKGATIKELSPEVAIESALLTNGLHGDPADRIIVATAKVFDAILLTRDHKILSWAGSGHIRFLQA